MKRRVVEVESVEVGGGVERGIAVALHSGEEEEEDRAWLLHIRI